MAKSRVKSSEEYDRILGVNPSNKEEEINKPIVSEPAKKTNDASRYFDNLREDNKTANSNPFERMISVEEIRESLKKTEKNVSSVESIKAEIASAQKNPGETVVSTPTIEVDHSYTEQSDGFSFEENARKLYENLRGSHLNKQAKPIYSNEEKEEVRKPDAITEIEEPISISKERVTKTEPETVAVAPVMELPVTEVIDTSIENVQELIDPIAEIEEPVIIAEVAETIDLDEPIIDNNLGEINIEEKVADAPIDLEHISTINDDILESIDLNDVMTTPIETSSNIASELDEQINMMEYEKEEPNILEGTLSEKLVAENRLKQEPQIDLLSSDEPIFHKTRLNDTKSDALTMALNQESTIGLNKKDIEIAVDKKKNNAVLKDRIITGLIIIMIIVVIFLIWQTRKN